MQHALHAISPIDGRYYQKVKKLSAYFSEFALIKYRVRVEIEYFIALSTEVPQLKGKIHPEERASLRFLYENFSSADAHAIKAIEKITNHDVKAVEYFLKEQFDHLEMGAYKEFVHFALTSQDINNTAIPLSLKEGLEAVYVPLFEQLQRKINRLANEWVAVPMLARTHGQPATPTLVGRELFVFVERMNKQFQQLRQVPFSAKFGGATGNFNAHHVAYPQVDWVHFADRFVGDTLGLTRSKFTTQIEHYDNLAALFHALLRINTILIDLCRDFWTYISMDYFKQKLQKNEVGSSAMPHKVNPIDFENAEGNLGIANALFEHLAAKLPISRLQRDLTDSTVLRNIGVPLAHTVLAMESLLKGLDKIRLHPAKLHDDLEANWAVVGEAIQNILRRENYPNPYEALKMLTRGNDQLTQSVIHQFIDGLEVSESVKAELKQITPHNYLGMSL